MAAIIGGFGLYAATALHATRSPKVAPLLRPIPSPTTAPSGVSQSLFDARPVQSMQALQVSPVTQVSPVPTLWATTDHGEQLESTDMGSTWELVNAPGGAVDPAALGTTFSGASGWLATGTTLYATTDGGTTWSALRALPSPRGENVTLPWLERVSPSDG